MDEYSDDECWMKSVDEPTAVDAERQVRRRRVHV